MRRVRRSTAAPDPAIRAPHAASPLCHPKLPKVQAARGVVPARGSRRRLTHDGGRGKSPGFRGAGRHCALRDAFLWRANRLAGVYRKQLSRASIPVGVPGSIPIPPAPASHHPGEAPLLSPHREGMGSITRSRFPPGWGQGGVGTWNHRCGVTPDKVQTEGHGSIAGLVARAMGRSPALAGRGGDTPGGHPHRVPGTPGGGEQEVTAETAPGAASLSRAPISRRGVWGVPSPLRSWE